MSGVPRISGGDSRASDADAVHETPVEGRFWIHVAGPRCSHPACTTQGVRLRRPMEKLPPDAGLDVGDDCKRITVGSRFRGDG